MVVQPESINSAIAVCVDTWIISGVRCDQIMYRFVSHPNSSGLAMDQLTRLFVPPHFVRRVEVSFAGEPVMTADVDFSISENPNFRFYFVPAREGELKAVIVDSKDLRFESSVAIKPGIGG